MKALIVFLVTFFLVACTVKEVKKEEVETKPADNAKKEEVISTWADEKKNYWTSLTFAQLSMQPQVRMRFAPWYLFKIAQCMVIEYEKLYPDYYWWEKNVGLNQHNLNPIYAREIYDITYKCSWIQGQMQQKEMLKKSEVPLDLKDSI
tara:strand:+ start:99 stop:542 length:444 start_codon:yes stop_codon:yes gene_type:complete